jgi:hypothetical protein
VEIGKVEIQRGPKHVEASSTTTNIYMLLPADMAANGTDTQKRPF